MKSLKYSLKYILLTAMLALALGGCSDSDSTPGAGAKATDPVLLEKLFVSVEDQGVVKSIHLHDEAGEHASVIKVAAPTAVEATINLADNPGAGPGEMVFSGGNAYVRVNNTNTVQMFDVETGGLTHNHPITVGVGPIHMYLDHDKNVWVMNDGLRTPNGVSCPGVDPACDPDTVSFIEGGKHAVHKSIRVGSGHHKMAFATDKKRAFVSNIHDGTLSVIDTDPLSTGYLTTTLNDLSLNGDAAMVTGLNPNGIDYAPHNMKIYSLNTREAVNVISVIDPDTLAKTFITKGNAADQVPAVGRLHTRHAHGDPSDGRFVYILANTEDDNGTPADPSDDTTTGWVIVIDTMNTHISNGIIAKTQIPSMRPARIIFGPHAKRLYIPSGVPFGGGTGTPDLQIDQLAVIDIDPTSTTFNQLLKKITVGKAGGHGSIAATSGDGHFLFVGNAGETTVSVVDTTALSVVGTIDVGGAPSGIGVTAVGTPADAGTGGDTGGHDHG